MGKSPSSFWDKASFMIDPEKGGLRGCLHDLSRVLTLDADHLFQRVAHFHQVGLIGHYAVNILVGAGYLVDHAFVLAANDALRLFFEVVLGELFFRHGAAHAPASAMRCLMPRGNRPHAELR